MEIKNKISVVIPTHDMKGKLDFLTRSLDAIWDQTLQDTEIIVTDNSDDDEIKDMCEWYGSIKYFKNPIKGMAQNTNAGIKLAKGKLIKILYLDDFLAHPKALQKIWESFDKGWLVTACEHYDGLDRMNRHYATYNGEIQFGNNTIGSPSVLTIENKNPLMFDEEMTWLLDCDYYKRLHERYGEPTILRDVGVVIGIGGHQATHIISDERKVSEAVYMKNKYA